MRSLILLCAALVWTGCLRIDLDDCRYSEERSATLDATELERVSLDVGAGRLVVEGRSDLDRIEVEGRACASRHRDLRRMELRADARGDTARIQTRFDSRPWHRQARLDLAVRVPTRLAVEVEDSSGDIEIRDVRSVRLEDGSGDVFIEHIDGEVRIDDGSGDVEVHDAGSVLVEDDGSGDLEIDDIDGDVTIEDDGSGDIRVTRIRGDLRVRDDGSGDLDYFDIEGSVHVP